MIRKIRLAFLFFALMLSLAAGRSAVHAITIGELLGWESESSKQDYPGESSDSAGKQESGKEQFGKTKSGKDKTVKEQSGQDKDSHNDSGSGDDASDFYAGLHVDEDASYDTKDEVCAFLVQFHHLPDNYMTKKNARKEGWEGGALSRLIPGKCIGGDHFGNYEGILPEKEGREYHECDIDTLGKSGRGAKRIIYSGDDDNEEWNIYYTEDHYESFTLLWGDDDYE